MRRKLLAITTVVGLIGLGALAILKWTGPRTASMEFHGVVVDEDSRPIEGARVTAESAYVRMERHSSGRSRWVKEEVRELEALTDTSGRFSLKFDGNWLRIGGISAGGRSWLQDLLWVPSSDPNANDFYTFHRTDIRNYVPDPSRPAVFPLIHRNATRLPPTSRGGSDRYPDGRVILNEPVVPRLPNVGPGSPTTPLERGQRIRELLTTQPSSRSVLQ